MQNGPGYPEPILHFELILLLLWRRQARFDGLETVIHLLKEALEFFEAQISRGLLSRASRGWFFGFVIRAVSSPRMSSGLGIRGPFQARDLALDHRGHFDAEVVAL